MSIWASEEIAGVDDDDNLDSSVVSYISGWSNHYPGHFPPPFDFEDRSLGRRGPANDLSEETPASVGTAWLPPWCVPGHHETEDVEGPDIDTHVGPWLRLDVTMRNVSIWAGVEIGNQDVHSVCMNEAAVRALRDNLTEWLEREKVHPEAASVYRGEQR